MSPNRHLQENADPISLDHSDISVVGVASKARRPIAVLSSRVSRPTSSLFRAAAKGIMRWKAAQRSHVVTQTHGQMVLDVDMLSPTSRCYYLCWARKVAEMHFSQKNPTD